MSFVLIDRRKAGRGKSSPNRQKLIRRIKSFIKSSNPQNVGKFGGVTGQNHSAPTGGGTSPVKVAGSALEEPYFAYANDGEHTQVLIGNKEYDRGDEIELPDQDGSSPKGGPGDGGEDDFIVNIARSEFLELFYEDCELPNLLNEKYTEKVDNTTQPAGFSTTGSPAQLSIVRTYKQAISRIAAMAYPFEQERDELQKELAKLKENIRMYNSDSAPMYDPVESIRIATDRIAVIEKRLAEIEEELVFLDGFDNSDMRYRKKEAKPLKTVDAVLFLLMDISGSMDENKKMIARRWFALLYGFIERRYKGSVELVFIAHTDEPFEMSEDDFFSTRVNGGTTVSPALELINRIIRERFDPNQTNIYISHASDGDNWDDDNVKVIDEMVGAGRLMNKIQFFSYVEVGKQGSGGWFNVGAGTTPGHSREDSGLWKAYDECRGEVAQNKIILSVIESAEECYPVFKRVFKKSKS